MYFFQDQQCLLIIMKARYSNRRIQLKGSSVEYLLIRFIIEIQHCVSTYFTVKQFLLPTVGINVHYTARIRFFKYYYDRFR